MMIAIPPNSGKDYLFWKNKEKQDRQQEIDNMLYMAEYQFSQFVESKMKDIDNLVREIENRLHQTDLNIEANINGNALTSQTINREIKKIVLNEFEKALK